MTLADAIGIKSAAHFCIRRFKMHSWVFLVAQLCGVCPRRGHVKQNKLLVRVEDLLVCFCFCLHESSSPQGGRIGSSVPLVNHAFTLLGALFLKKSDWGLNENHIWFLVFFAFLFSSSSVLAFCCMFR